MGNNYTVYMHTNLINNKKYIGITSKKPEIRWGRGIGYKSNNYFYSSILKYGWDDGFVHTIIETNMSKKDACKKEIKLISFYQSNNPSYGYNLSAGGESGGAGIKKSKELIEKLRNQDKSKFYKPVLCIETGIVYKSLTEAYNLTNICQNSISKCCKFVYKTAGGYHWTFINDKDKIYSNNINSQKTGVDIICIETKEVFNINSKPDIYNKSSRQSIRNCCNGKSLTALGFHWMFYEEYKKFGYIHRISKPSKKQRI